MSVRRSFLDQFLTGYRRLLSLQYAAMSIRRSFPLPLDLVHPEELDAAPRDSLVVRQSATVAGSAARRRQLHDDDNNMAGASTCERFGISTVYELAVRSSRGACALSQ